MEEILTDNIIDVIFDWQDRCFREIEFCLMEKLSCRSLNEIMERGMRVVDPFVGEKWYFDNKLLLEVKSIHLKEINLPICMIIMEN